MTDALRARAAIDRMAGDYESAAEHLEQVQPILDGQVAHLVGVLVAIAAAALEVVTGHAVEAVHRLDRLDVAARMAAADPAYSPRSRRPAAAATATTVAAPAPPPDTSVRGRQQLTDRELVVLRFLSSHLTLPEPASELDVSRNTIKTQVAAMYRKLGATSRSETVELGRQQGLVGRRP